MISAKIRAYNTNHVIGIYVLYIFAPDNLFDSDCTGCIKKKVIQLWHVIVR